MLRQRSFSEFQQRLAEIFQSEREIQNVIGMVEVGAITLSEEVRPGAAGKALCKN